MVRMKRALLPLTLLLSGCSLFQQAAAPVASPSAAVSPSPSPSPLVRAVWVLSPLGLNLRDNPDASAKILASIPQGTQVTATDFRAGTPGWYHVAYQGTTGWIAAKALTSVHPQLAYASAAAGYYLLYPSSWQLTDRVPDIEIDGPGVTPVLPQPGTPAPSPTSTAVAGPQLLVHEAKDVNSLGNTPTTPGSLLATDSIEVYGITVVQRTYTLTGNAGLESDVKLKLSADKAVLITFRGKGQSDLDSFTEILESFGVSLPPTATPSP